MKQPRNLKTIVSLLFFTLLLLNAKAQELSPEMLGLKAFAIDDEVLGRIDYYVSANKIEDKKPVLLYLDGSGAYPLFQHTSQGIGSSVIIDFRSLANSYHVVMISKPGVPLIDSVGFDPQIGIPLYPVPQLYSEKLSLDWRVNSADLVLKKIKKELKVEDRKVAVLGISEGFQVAAKLGTVNKNITHLLLFVGNGLNQFFDFIIQNRIDAQSGRISDAEAQSNIDSLYAAIRDIYAHPDATDKEWYGHTYLRWASFCNNNPTENLMELEIPVYIAGAGNDRNTAVLGTDYLYLESIRRNKTNITYKVYPYDHSFNEQVKNEEGEVVGMKNHIQEVIVEGLNWLLEK